MHIIRLRGFWETTATEDGSFRHLRRFGRPTNLDAEEHVWLCGDPREEPDSLHLNGEILGTLTPFAFDITSKLEPRNEILITSAGEAPPAELRLEIRPAQ